jgi:hypothetical protein
MHTEDTSAALQADHRHKRHGSMAKQPLAGGAVANSRRQAMLTIEAR